MYIYIEKYIVLFLHECTVFVMLNKEITVLTNGII